MEDDYFPTKLMVLSELSVRDKETYYKMILSNGNMKLRRDPLTGNYIASLRLLGPNVKKADEPISNIIKRKDMNNYSLIFQERLKRLKENGLITVRLTGISNPIDYNSYPRFVALIANQNDSVSPKLRPLSWVMKIIEDIYDNRFSHEKNEVEREENYDSTASFDLMLLIFPVFVVRRLGTNVGLKSLLDQTGWDLLYSTHIYRKDYLECELFGRFLSEFYDHDDLLFFLYVRSVIANVLHISFKLHWTKSDGPKKSFKESLWMSYRESSQVAKIIFGQDNQSMLRDFMLLIIPHMVGQRTEQSDSRRITIAEFLHLSVVGYHHAQTKPSNDSNQPRMLVPIPGQTAEDIPVPMINDDEEAIIEQDLIRRRMQLSNNNQSNKNKNKDNYNNNTNNNNNNSFAQYQPHDIDYDQSDNHFFDAEEREFAAEYNNNPNSHLDVVFNGLNLNSNESDYYGNDVYGERLYNDAAGISNVLPYSDNVNNHINHIEMGDDLDDEMINLQSLASSVTEHKRPLQVQREGEFLDYIFQPLANLPEEYAIAIQADISERLRQTVNIYLSDKTIDDIDALDDNLLDLLQQDQLRIDMESIRDEIIEHFMNGNNGGSENAEPDDDENDRME
eukprot:gene10908-14646_t